MRIASTSTQTSYAAEAGYGCLQSEPRALGAYGVGLVHGVAGSAAVGVLVIASVESTALAVLAPGLE
jgi:hypothetical protein